MGMQLIETIEVGAGGAASIEFTGIPQDGVDLVYAISARSNYTGFSIDNLEVLLNDVSINRSLVALYGSGSSVASFSESTIRGGFIPANIATSNTFGSSQVYVSNYASGSPKSVSVDSVNENNATAAYQMLVAGLWNDTSAVTSIKFNLNNGNFMQYSTASLYMITAD